jgi:uncharacterized MAPEG superfamily protein
MKTELLFLLLTALLTGCLWIPVVIGYAKTRGPIQPEDYVIAPTSPLPAWVNRANRAHANAIESFAPFAAVVMVALAGGISNSLTQACAATYFIARLLHAIVHISGFKHFMARTVIFVIAWLAFAIYGFSLLPKLL